MTLKQAAQLVAEAKKDARLTAQIKAPLDEQASDGYRVTVILRGVMKVTLATLREWGCFKRKWKGY